jgi:predicted amino acid racemase
VPLGETAAIAPFQSEPEEDTTPGQRGYRALIGIGQLDTDIYGLTPVNPHYQIAGASSDITVINLGEDADGLKVGDTILFRPNYSALLRLMSGRYLEKAVTPSLEDFSRRLSEKPLAFEPVFQAAV